MNRNIFIYQGNKNEIATRPQFTEATGHEGHMYIFLSCSWELSWELLAACSERHGAKGVQKWTRQLKISALFLVWRLIYLSLSGFLWNIGIESCYSYIHLGYKVGYVLPSWVEKSHEHITERWDSVDKYKNGKLSRKWRLTESELRELEFPQIKISDLNPFKANSSKKKVISIKIEIWSFWELLHHFTWVLKILGSFTNTTEEFKFFQM